MFESFSALMGGFQSILTPPLIFSSFLGCLIGIIVGVIPALGATAGIAILLPSIYGKDPLTSLVMLAGIFFGSTFGGTITAVLINVPGAPCNICTVLDGYPIAKKGRPGAAIGMGSISSVVGGTIGAVLLTLAAVPLARWGLRLSAPEYFAVYFFAFMCLLNTMGEQFYKGLMALFVGFLVAFIGHDSLTGVTRFTFDNINFYDGVNFVPALIGLFGLGEIFCQIIDADSGKRTEDLSKTAKLTFRNMFPRLSELARCPLVWLRSSVIGFFTGVLPGAGGSTASFFAYEFEKGIAKNKDEWGTGVMEGVAAAEAANSSCFAGTYVPLFALGIPGSSTSAMLLGALIILGCTPGPAFFTENPALAWGTIASMYMANVILIVVCSLMCPLFLWVLKSTGKVLVTGVMTLCFVGVYCLNSEIIDLWVMLVFGVIGYFCKIRKIPINPMVLALILGSNTEVALRRGLVIAKGSWYAFCARPITAVFLIAAVAMFIMGLFSFIKANKKRKGEIQ